jgi:hypothetical protein
MPGSICRAFCCLNLDHGLESWIAAIILHVLDGTVIAFAEAFTKLLTLSLLHLRVTVCLVVVSIHSTALLNIAARRFHTFMEAPALGITVTIRRFVPMIRMLLILANGAAGLSMYLQGPG